MTLYLLPKRGIGNSATFDLNGYTFTKSATAGVPWHNALVPYDVGIFDNSTNTAFTQRYSVSYPQLDYITPVNAADGTITTTVPTYETGGNGTTSVSYHGWVTPGIYLVEGDMSSTMSHIFSVTGSNRVVVSGGSNYWGLNAVGEYSKSFSIGSNTYVVRAVVFSKSPLNTPAFDTVTSIPMGTALAGSFTNSNLTFTNTTTGSKTDPVRCCYPMSTGKWYWEFTCNTLATSSISGALGVRTGEYPWNSWVGSATGSSIGYQFASGSLTAHGTSQATYATIVSGDKLMFAFDADTRKLWVGKNGTWFNSGDPAAGTGFVYQEATAQSSPYFPMISIGNIGNSFTLAHSTFTYSVPGGFSAYGSIDPIMHKTDGVFMIASVPYLASANTTTSSSPFSTSFGPFVNGNATPFTVTSTTTHGSSNYTSVGRSSINSFLSWIISDLVECTDFVSPPATRLSQSVPASNIVTPRLSNTYAADYTTSTLIPPPISVWGFWQHASTILGTQVGAVLSRPQVTKWQYTNTTMPTSYNGYITGTVLDTGVPVAGANVFLFRREHLAFIDSKKTNLDGRFSFDLLDSTSSNYFVVAQDPDDGVVYNAKVFDRLTPTTTPPSATDPLWSAVSLFINGTTVADISTNAFTLTQNGTVLPSTLTISPTNSAIHFDGTNSLSAVASVKFDSATQMAIEGYVTLSAFSACTLVRLENGTSGQNFSINLTAGGLLTAYYANATSDAAVLSTVYAVPVGVRTHFALVKDDKTYSLYVGGVLVGSSTNTTATPSGTGVLHVGENLNGYLDQVRITKGFTRYTRTFVPQFSLPIGA